MEKMLTLSKDNKFSFVCPLFNATTKLASCVYLRDLVWKGKTVPQRRGCQAAMKSGKCPAAQIVSGIAFGYARGDQDSAYGATEEKVGKLRAEVLSRIRPVMMQEKIIQQLNVPAKEIMLLEGANERIDAQLKTAPGEPLPTVSDYHSPKHGGKSTKSAKAAPVKNKKQEAARTGDMAAAINS